MTYDLSVLIPARNEFYGEVDLLANTVANVLENASERTEVIVILDGYQPLTELKSDPRLTVVHHNKAIGQRAATNEAAHLSQAKYVMKLDAHCALAKDFDTILLNDMQPHWTMVPLQYNLLAFNWKCKRCGQLRDQGPTPATTAKPNCLNCNSKYFKQVVQWIPRDGREGSDGKGGKRNSDTESWCFDTNLDFQYWGQYASNEAYCKKHKIPFRPETQADIHDTMSLIGACWLIERERYHKLNLLDEKYGSWGQMGTEIACKTWTSGGELKVNKKSWFAHFFRVGGIPFPYPGGGHKERASARCREIWLKNQWEHQIHPLSWIIEKFAPIPDWRDDNEVWQRVKAAGDEFYKRPVSSTIIKTGPSKGALYYTCNTHDLTLELAARNNLLRSTNGHELGCVSLQRTDFGDWNIVVNRERSGTTMHYQIYQGLLRMKADYVFLCESDVFYHPSHFDFTPERDDIFYYNTNVWRIRYSDGHAVRTDNLQQVSGICASRKLLIDHYRKRIELIEREGKFDPKQMAYEPGTRGKFGDEKVANWESLFPNVDVTDHGKTLTKPKFSVAEFRNKRYAQGWTETDEALPGWPQLSGRLQEFLQELANG